MKHKIAFIYPKSRDVLDTNEPLNILIMATYLKNAGIDVKIIDELAGDNVIDELKSYSPELVGFTATTCTYPRAVEILAMIRPLNYKTIIGGVHASTLPKQALNDGFDMVVVGEGERMLLEIINKGEKQGVFKAPREKILKSAEIPIPDRTLINMDFYRNSKFRSPHDNNLDFVPFGKYVGSMLTSRGCPYNCIFCHNGWRGTPVRLIEPATVVEEIEGLIHEQDIHHIWFLDDDFFISKKRAREICNLIVEKKLDVYWSTSTRPGSVDDEDLLSLAARAGCKRLAFGFESGSQRILKVLNKKMSIGQNLRAVRLCHKAGIDVLGLIMVGNPTETKEDIDLTWNFIKRADLDSIAISVLTPFPGTQLWDWCKREASIPQDVDWSLFYYTRAPIQIPETFSPREVEAIKRNLLIKIYLCNSKIRKKFLTKLLKHPYKMIEKLLDYMPFAKKGAT